MHWLDLFSQFDTTIHPVPVKANFFTDVLSWQPELAAVLGSVESSLLTWIIRLRQLLLMTHGKGLRKWEVLVSVFLYSVMVFCAAHEVGLKSVS